MRCLSLSSLDYQEKLPQAPEFAGATIAGSLEKHQSFFRQYGECSPCVATSLNASGNFVGFSLESFPDLQVLEYYEPDFKITPLDRSSSEDIEGHRSEAARDCIRIDGTLNKHRILTFLMFRYWGNDRFGGALPPLFRFFHGADRRFRMEISFGVDVFAEDAEDGSWVSRLHL